MEVIETSSLDVLIQQTVKEFEPDETAIAALTHYGEMTVETNGIAVVTEARKQVKRLRIAIDRRRKELNEGALKYQRAINAEAKRLVEIIEPIEGHLTAQEEQHEAEKLAERQRIEAEKNAVIDGRIQRLQAVGFSGMDRNAVAAMDPQWFEAFLQNESEKHERVEAERLELERLRAEEQKRIAAERKETERQERELREAAQRMKEAAEAEVRKPLITQVKAFTDRMRDHAVKESAALQDIRLHQRVTVILRDAFEACEQAAWRIEL